MKTHNMHDGVGDGNDDDSLSFKCWTRFKLEIYSFCVNYINFSRWIICDCHHISNWSEQVSLGMMKYSKNNSFKLVVLSQCPRYAFQSLGLHYNVRNEHDAPVFHKKLEFHSIPELLNFNSRIDSHPFSLGSNFTCNCTQVASQTSI